MKKSECKKYRFSLSFDYKGHLAERVYASLLLLEGALSCLDLPEKKEEAVKTSSQG